MIHVISVSGGKDSTALWLWALETGLSPILPLFCDTKWERDETYAYLDFLEARLGPLVRLESEGFEERTRRLGTFPSRVRKWCSPELKVAMCAAELDRIRERTGDDVEVLVGVRRDESEARKDLTEREWHDDYDCEVWRPLIDWTLPDVIAAHNRARMPLNPLYKLGAERVGCWPCIHARKSELRLIGELDPERVERVAAIERDIGQTMFTIEKSRKGLPKDAPYEKQPVGIREAVLWARTSRGAKQIALIPEPSGCSKWGTCEF